MTTPATNKRNGARAEIVWCDWLNAQGRHAVRVRLNGVTDLGDVHEIRWMRSLHAVDAHPDFGQPDHVVVWEVKSAARLDVANWLRQLRREVANVQAQHPGAIVTGRLVVRPKGQPDPAKWWVIDEAEVVA